MEIIFRVNDNLYSQCIKKMAERSFFVCEEVPQIFSEENRITYSRGDRYPTIYEVHSINKVNFV